MRVDVYTDITLQSAIFGTHMELLEMCRTTDFDVLGHATLPLRYICRTAALRHVDFSGDQERFQAIFQTVIERGRGIELNVSGWADVPSLTMPDMPLLKLYRKLGGECITVGSDAHQMSQVGRGIAAGYDLLREAGFRYVATYRERRPRFVPL